MTAPARRGPGRPAALPTGARTSSVTLRLSEAERAAWEAAAAMAASDLGRPLTLADYVRAAVTADALARADERPRPRKRSRS